MSSFTIRRGEPGDARALVDLARAVAAEPEGWLLSEGEWRSVADERRALKSQRWADEFAVFVAVDGAGRPVGRLSLVRDDHTACHHVADLGIMVAREWRGRGVGTALLAAAAAWAASVGIARIELHVFPHNEGAIALYERCGYRREGVRRGQFLRGGQLVDALLMALLLPVAAAASP